MYRYMFFNYLWLRFFIIIYLVCVYFYSYKIRNLKIVKIFFKYKLFDLVVGFES